MAHRSGKTDPPTRLDDVSWELMYRRHADELTRFIAGVLRDRSWAEEVVQVAFAKLLERGGEVQPDARKAWLFQVAMREALAQRRKRGRRQELLEEAFWSRQPMATDVGDALEREEEIEKLRLALDGLPKSQREVVRRRIYLGQSFAKIAQELGIPLGTALGRMRLATKHLREAMAAAESPADTLTREQEQANE